MTAKMCSAADEFDLSSSTMSLDRVGLVARTDLGTELNHITQRTPRKCPSLGNLAEVSLRREADCLEEFGLNVFHDSRKTVAVWKAYCQMVKKAWRKSKVVLANQRRKAEELELAERSSVIQLSSMASILMQDRVILRDQSQKLLAMMALKDQAGKEICVLKKNCDRLKSEIVLRKETLDQVNIMLCTASEMLSSKQNKLSELENVVSERQKKNENYEKELSVKRTKVIELERHVASNQRHVENLEEKIKLSEESRNRLIERLKDDESALQQLTDVLQRKNDENALLEKELSEVEDANAAAEIELSTMQMKLLDQDVTVSRLENELNVRLEELADLEEQRAKRANRKGFYVMWAATCLLHVLQAFDGNGWS